MKKEFGAISKEYRDAVPLAVSGILIPAAQELHLNGHFAIGLL
tara:strand:- start:399 stop:527 length:129 start_codon:yes stop_codon:yes gene_type:complete